MIFLPFPDAQNEGNWQKRKVHFLPAFPQILDLVMVARPLLMMRGVYARRGLLHGPLVQWPSVHFVQVLWLLQSRFDNRRNWTNDLFENIEGRKPERFFTHRDTKMNHLSSGKCFSALFLEQTTKKKAIKKRVSLLRQSGSILRWPIPTTYVDFTLRMKKKRVLEGTRKKGRLIPSQ